MHKVLMVLMLVLASCAPLTTPEPTQNASPTPPPVKPSATPPQETATLVPTVKHTKHPGLVSTVTAVETKILPSSAPTDQGCARLFEPVNGTILPDGAGVRFDWEDFPGAKHYVLFIEYPNGELETRSEILLNFTKALIYFSEKELDSALLAIQDAISAVNKIEKPPNGSEAIYLLAAKIEAEQNNRDAANQMLDKALEINPQYARAYLVRGNLLYTQAQQMNDPALLAAALDQYRQAKDMPDPEGAYIRIKAHTGMGNALAVQAQLAKDPVLFQQAEESYNYVIQKYQKTRDPVMRKYAAIAYFGLGAVYERQGDKDKAIPAYQQAYDLAETQQFKEQITQQMQEAQK